MLHSCSAPLMQVIWLCSCGANQANVSCCRRALTGTSHPTCTAREACQAGANVPLAHCRSPGRDGTPHAGLVLKPLTQLDGGAVTVAVALEVDTNCKAALNA